MYAMTSCASLSLARSWRKCRRSRSAAVFLRDAGHGLLEISHNSLALLGLLILGAAALRRAAAPTCGTPSRPETLDWLQARHDARLQASADAASEPDLGEPDAIARATAVDPSDLSRASRPSVAMWLSRRYHVAPEPVSRLVQEAWTVGRAGRPRSDPDPGHHGGRVELQPVRPEPGRRAGPDAGHDQDPRRQVRGLRRQPRRLRPGHQPARRRPGAEGMHRPRAAASKPGLRYYVGAANLGDDGGYAAKVLAEQSILRQIAGGRQGADRDGGRPDDSARRRLPPPRRRRRSRCRRRVAEPPAAAAADGTPRRTASRSCAEPADGGVRYTADAVRLAMRLRRRSPRWTTTGKRGRRLRGTPSVEPFAWAAPRADAVRVSRGSPSKDCLPCSTATTPPSPTSTPRSLRRSSARTGARKSTSSSSRRRTTPRRR